MFKKCSVCKKEQAALLFYKNRGRKDGLTSECKACIKIQRQSSKGREIGKKASQRVRRSYRGHLFQLYNSIKHRLKYREQARHRQLCFSVEEFFIWVETKSNYKEIHEAWVASNYQLKLSPSLDRIKEEGDYTLDNIQIITFGENSQKFWRGRKRDGRGGKALPQKVVEAFTNNSQRVIVERVKRR